MASATKIPNFNFFQWATPTAPNPRLASPISASDTTLVFTSAPLDGSGAAITGNFLMGIKRSDGYVETIYVPAGAISGFTATGVTRGIRLAGLDFTTAGTGTAVAHLQDEEVFCNVTGVFQSIMNAWAQGTLASGGSGLIIGTDATGTTTVSRSTGAGTNVGFLRWLTGTTKAQFSNDGAAWVNFDSVSASNLVAVSATDTTPNYLLPKLVAGTATTLTQNNIGGNETITIAIDPSTLDIKVKNTAADTTADYLNSKVAAGTHITKTTLNPAGNEQLQLATDAIQTSSGAGSANKLIATNSSGLLDNTFLNSDAPVLTYTSYEAITANDAVAAMPIEVELYDTLFLTPATINLGDLDANRNYAIKVIPSVTSSNLTTMQFSAAEAVNASTNGQIQISIQTDNAGAPSNTVIANGSANVITQATIRTWNVTQALRTATWAAAPTLTAGTTYWIVFNISFTDAANFVKLGTNDTYVNNYPTFTRMTGNQLASPTWSGAVTNATPFFNFNTQKALLGMCVVQCRADVGRRTWQFIGFAKSTVAANASVDVYYDIVPSLTGLTPNALYNLSATPGAISTSFVNSVGMIDGTNPSNFQYRIGRAISSTQLKIEKGQKRVLINETGLGASITRAYLIWFRPEMITGQAIGLATNENAPLCISVTVGHTTSAGASASVMGTEHDAANNTSMTAATTNFLSTLNNGAHGFSVSATPSSAEMGVNAIYTRTTTGTIRAVLQAVQ